RSTLYVADPAAGLVRALDPRAGTLTAIAGGGDRLGTDGDGGPATAASLLPRSLAFDGEGHLILRDGLSGSFRGVNLDTGVLGSVLPWLKGTCATGGVDACSSDCRVSYDRAGTPFVSGIFCIAAGTSLGTVRSVSPGVARYARDGSFVPIAGRAP